MRHVIVGVIGLVALTAAASWLPPDWPLQVKTFAEGVVQVWIDARPVRVPEAVMVRLADCPPAP